MANNGIAKRSRRLKAYLIDSILLGVAVSIGVVIFLNNISKDTTLTLIPVLYAAAFPLIFTGLQLNLLFNSSQTLGKVHQNIIIVDSETKLRAGFGKILLRLFVSMVMRIIPPMGLVDALCIFGKERKCLHDMIAETVVLDELDVKSTKPATP